MIDEASQVRWSGRHAMVAAPAEIDLNNAAELDEILAAVAGLSAAIITVDMTRTEFCDSAGLHALARAYRHGVDTDLELRIAVGDSPVARILQLTGMDQILPIYRDVEESLATPRTGH